MPITTGGILRNISVRHNVPAGNGQNIAYTVFVNGVPTILAVILASTQSQNSNTAAGIVVPPNSFIAVVANAPTNIGATPLGIVATVGFQPT